MRKVIAYCVSYSLLISTIAVAAPAQQRNLSRFDGLWTVLVITDSGTCDRAYRYGVRIMGGQIRYAGEAGIQFSGTVAANGNVTVAVQSGDRTATGSGRLSTDDGGGTWAGTSPGNRCSGRWEAERR
jgi:hypothetical protein